MKRAIIAAVLLLCAGGNANADHLEIHWYDTIRPHGHKRSDDVGAADAKICSDKVGEQMVSVSAAYKTCMRELGYRYMFARMIRTPDVSDDGRLVCSAKVLKVEDTGWALNHHPFARLTFRITARGSKPYETTVGKEVSWHNPPRAGQTLRVYCDPANPSEVHPAD